MWEFPWHWHWSVYLLTLNAIAWGVITYNIRLGRRLRCEYRELEETRALTQQNLERSEQLLDAIIATAAYNDPEAVKAMLLSLPRIH